MYFIKCRFRRKEHSDWLNGYAVCSDPNTPITFIYPNGEPHTGDIWSYTLMHHEPWFKSEYV